MFWSASVFFAISAESKIISLCDMDENWKVFLTHAGAWMAVCGCAHVFTHIQELGFQFHISSSPCRCIPSSAFLNHVYIALT